jgi:hypothetical protein
MDFVFLSSAAGSAFPVGWLRVWPNAAGLLATETVGVSGFVVGTAFETTPVFGRSCWLFHRQRIEQIASAKADAEQGLVLRVGRSVMALLAGGIAQFGEEGAVEDVGHFTSWTWMISRVSGLVNTGFFV